MTPQPSTTLEDLRSVNLLPEDPIAVYLSGSRVLGWGHANSDIDVFVITTDDVGPVHPLGQSLVTRARILAEPAEVTIAVAFVAGERCDVEYWQEEQVNQLIARMEGSDVAGGSVPPPLDQTEADFLFRLSVGMPLDGASWIVDRQEALARSDFRNVIAARFFDEADELVDDAVGLLRSGDVESALLAAGPAFGLVVDGLLALAGQLYPSAKWRARKLRAVSLEGLAWDEYWSFETRAELDARDPRPWVERLLARTQELMTNAELG